MIKIKDDLYLKSFNYEEDYSIIEEINGKSKSPMIHNIDERLIRSRDTVDVEFNNAYLVVFNDDIVGYVYLSGISHNKFYFEYLVLKGYRNMGIGSYILDSVVDNVFFNNPNIESCVLSIDKSNIASLMVARNNCFFEDEDTLFMDKIDFVKDNPYNLYFGR